MISLIYNDLIYHVNLLPGMSLRGLEIITESFLTYFVLSEVVYILFCSWTSVNQSITQTACTC